MLQNQLLDNQYWKMLTWVSSMGLLFWLNWIELFSYYCNSAKIGILGINGAGKSTLMKIISGEDDEIDGKCILKLNNYYWLTIPWNRRNKTISWS